MGIFKRSYSWLVNAENSLRHPLLLGIRLFWGFQLISISFGKWMHLYGVASHLSGLGYRTPLFYAVLTTLIECLGAISLILGLFSRFFSLFLVIISFMTYPILFKGNISELFSLSQDKPFLFLYASLIILCFGPGLFSFDHWIEKKLYGKSFS